MSANHLFLIEFLVFSGVALVWAGYEFWSVRPKRDRETPGVSGETRHPEG